MSKRYPTAEKAEIKMGTPENVVKGCLEAFGHDPILLGNNFVCDSCGELLAYRSLTDEKKLFNFYAHAWKECERPGPQAQMSFDLE